MDLRLKQSSFDYKSYQKKSTKLPQVAATLQHLLSNVPQNFIDLLNNYNCDICAKDISTLKGAVSHYNSDIHQSRLKAAGISDGVFELPFTPSQILDLETGVLICARGSNKVHLVDPISKVKTEEFTVPDGVNNLDLEYCILCNIPFVSSLMALQHYKGKKHKQRFFAKLTAPTDNRAMTENFRCSLCNVATSSEETLQTHLDGNPHQKKLAKCIDENNNRSVPPESASNWGTIDYDAEHDESFQPFGIPAPFYDCKLNYHTPHIRLNGPYDSSQPPQIKTEPDIICTESRTEYDKDVLRHYLETVYK